MKKLTAFFLSFLLIFCCILPGTVKASTTTNTELVSETTQTEESETTILEENNVLETPTSFSAKQVKKESVVNLTWEKVPYATGYQIFRSTSFDSGYKRIKTVGKVTTYKDKKAKDGTIYYYKIRAIQKNNNALKSEYTEPVLLCMKPGKTEVTGEYKRKGVRLSWEKVTGAQTYIVFKKNEKGKYIKVKETKKLTYTDKAVEKEKEYSYKVAASYINLDKQYTGYKSDVCKVFTSAIDPNKKMVALTFDDGPGPYTKEIVDCLKKYNSKATFFVVGNRVNSYKSALKYTYDAGNEIANHSYDHTILTTISGSSVKWQMDATDSAVKKVIGVKTSIARTPGGAVNSTVKSKVGKPIIFWSIDTLDWKTRSKTKTIQSVMNNVKDGDIVLMHDIHYPTKEAALELIPKLKSKGYQLVTVSELAKYRGYDMKNGTVYSSFRK